MGGGYPDRWFQKKSVKGERDSPPIPPLFTKKKKFGKKNYFLDLSVDF